MKKISILLLLLIGAQIAIRADELVDRKTFFEHVIGMPEAAFQKDVDAKKAAISWNDAEQVYYLKRPDGTPFRSGNFEKHSIADLETATNALPKPGKGTFSVIEAIKPMTNPAYYYRVDVGANQAKPQNNNAVFQVASNFNGLELESADDKMPNILKYLGDPTQGPFASISAAPGLILRHYYAFYKQAPEKEPNYWQQHALLDGSFGRQWTKADENTQINLLEDTDIPVKNSYVSFNLKEPQLVNDFAKDKIKVLWHGNIQVTSGLMPAYSDEHTLLDRNDQFVNQVFTAGVDFGVENSAAYKKNLKAVAIAQAALDAAYEGTLRAAVKYGKKKVFLTLIGGGVFKNDLTWIAKAIKKMRQFIIDSGLEVTLIIFDGADKRFIDQIDKFRASMVKLTKETGGTYTQYSPDHPEGKILTSKELGIVDPNIIKLIAGKSPDNAINVLHASNIRFASQAEAEKFLRDDAKFTAPRIKVILKGISDLIQEEKPIEFAVDQKIVDLIRGKNFFNASSILDSKKIKFRSREEAKATLIAAGIKLEDYSGWQIEQFLEDSVIKPPMPGVDTLKDALNNLASALSNLATEIK